MDRLKQVNGEEAPSPKSLKTLTISSRFLSFLPIPALTRTSSRAPSGQGLRSLINFPRHRESSTSALTSTNARHLSSLGPCNTDASSPPGSRPSHRTAVISSVTAPSKTCSSALVTTLASSQRPRCAPMSLRACFVYASHLRLTPSMHVSQLPGRAPSHDRARRSRPHVA